MTASTALRNVPLILFGVGGVGQAVVKQIIAARSIHASRYGLRFNFVALSDSTGYVADLQSDDETLETLKWKSNSKSPFSTHPRGVKSSHPSNDCVKKYASTSSIVIDCSASSSTAESIVEAVLRYSSSVTMANKKPLSDSSSIFRSLLSNSHHSHLIRYESTCGAGTPFITTQHRLISSGDEIIQIQGTFSGTLGYLMSSIESGASYSEAVSTAYKLQYTEPDPRDDLSGTDVARKALILARSMNSKHESTELSDIDIQPLYKKEWSTLTVHEMMSRLSEMNDEFETQNKTAKSQGKVLRYIATITQSSISVGLKAVPRDSPLGQLKGTQNMAEYKTRIYNEAPLVVLGAGAGVQVTAAGVIADCVELANQQKQTKQSQAIQQQ